MIIVLLVLVVCLLLILCLCAAFAAGYWFCSQRKWRPKEPEVLSEKQSIDQKRERMELENFWSYDGTPQDKIE